MSQAIMMAVLCIVYIYMYFTYLLQIMDPSSFHAKKNVKRVIPECGSDDEDSSDESYNPSSYYASSDEADDTSSRNDTIEMTPWKQMKCKLLQLRPD